MNKPSRVEGIDVEVQLVFQAEHLQLLIPHLFKVGLTQSQLDELINAYIASGEAVPYERWILEYGQSVLNPLMNAKLRRNQNHPTFNNMLVYALKEIIEGHPIVQHFRKSKTELKSAATLSGTTISKD